MAPESEGGVFIPTRDIYEKLTVAVDELRRLSVQIAADRENVRRIEEKLAVTEDRMARLERWKYATPTATIFTIASLIYTIART